MGILDRFFGNGKDRDGQATAAASSQFYEHSQPDADDDKPGVSRNAPRRELVQVILRDTMRKHGIPSDWIECRILSTVSRSGRPGLHVNFVVRQAHDRLLAYVFAFQDSFQRELGRFEPRSSDWLLSLAWEFQGMSMDSLPDMRGWAQSAPAPLGEAGPGKPAAVEGFVEPDGLLAAPKADDDVQRDLDALFAIRDAALSDAAGKDQPHPDRPDFQATQPFDDPEPPRAR